MVTRGDCPPETAHRTLIMECEEGQGAPQDWTPATRSGKTMPSSVPSHGDTTEMTVAPPVVNVIKTEPQSDNEEDGNDWSAMVKTERESPTPGSSLLDSPDNIRTSDLTAFKTEPHSDSEEECKPLPNPAGVPRTETPGLLMKCEEEDVEDDQPELLMDREDNEPHSAGEVLDSPVCELCRVILPQGGYSHPGDGATLSHDTLPQVSSANSSPLPQQVPQQVPQQLPQNGTLFFNRGPPVLCAGCVLVYKEHCASLRGVTNGYPAEPVKHHRMRKLLRCEFCTKAFQYKSDLKRHELIHSGEKPHQCEMCGAAFSRLSNLEVHKRKHTGEKPYKCTECDKGFARLDDLNVHKRTHTGEKPYQCDLCGRSFSKKTNLNRHERTHALERPYVCPMCGQSFKDVSNLASHKRKQHENESM